MLNQRFERFAQFTLALMTSCVSLGLATGAFSQQPADRTVLEEPLAVATNADANNSLAEADYRGSKKAGILRATPGLAFKHAKVGDTAWNFETKLPRGRVLCMAINKQGNRLAIGSSDCNVRIYSIPDMTLLRLLPGEQSGQGVEDVSFSPDGKKVAVLHRISSFSANDEPADTLDTLALRIWSDDQLLLEQIIETSHGRWSNALVWPASSETLVAIFNRETYVFGPSTGDPSTSWKILASSRHTEDSLVMGSAYSDSLEKIVCFTSEKNDNDNAWESAIRLRSKNDVLKLGELVSLPEETEAHRFTKSPNGKRVAFQSESSGRLSVFDLGLRRIIYKSKFKSNFVSAAWGEHDDSLFVYLPEERKDSPGIFTGTLGEVDLRTTQIGVSKVWWSALWFDPEFAPIVFHASWGLAVGDTNLRLFSEKGRESLLSFEDKVSQVVSRPGNHYNVGIVVNDQFVVFDYEGREVWRKWPAYVKEKPWSSNGSLLFISGQLYEYSNEGAPAPKNFTGTRASGLLSPNGKFIGHLSEGKARIIAMETNRAIAEVEQLSSLVGQWRILGQFYPAATWHPTTGTFYVCDGQQVVSWKPGDGFFRRVNRKPLPELSAGFQLKWFGSGERLIIGDNIYALADDGSLEMLKTKLAGRPGLSGRAFASTTDAHALYEKDPDDGPVLLIYANVEARQPKTTIRLPSSLGTAFPRMAFLDGDTKIAVSDLSSAWILDLTSGKPLLRVVLLPDSESIGIDDAGKIAATTSEKALQNLIFYGISEDGKFVTVDKADDLPESVANAFGLTKIASLER